MEDGNGRRPLYSSYRHRRHPVETLERPEYQIQSIIWGKIVLTLPNHITNQKNRPLILLLLDYEYNLLTYDTT